MANLEEEAQQLTGRLGEIYSELEGSQTSGSIPQQEVTRARLDEGNNLAVRGWHVMIEAGHGVLYEQALNELDEYSREQAFQSIIDQPKIEQFGLDALVARYAEDIRRQLSHPDLTQVVVQFPEPYASLSAVLFNYFEVQFRRKYKRERDVVEALYRPS